MKTVNQQNNTPKKGNNNVPRPEIRDNLDSRKNEEQEFKGDDMTHNKKDHKSEKQGKK
ncbi:hypothetical protein [uncultured Chitinophaga sp.]|uniref:hypothetical protein n=1 Tax=uncultured Chitinophaga sp. TaxID=339340 RepID=UPI0025CF3939|nr:hypothetical protein [uncultured Chitinophaga sp.]